MKLQAIKLWVKQIALYGNQVRSWHFHKMLTVGLLLFVNCVLFPNWAKAADQEKRQVVEITFVDYVDGTCEVFGLDSLNNRAHSSSTKYDESSCYLLLGFKLTAPMPFVVNPLNPMMDEAFVTNRIDGATYTWNKASHQGLLSMSSAVDYSLTTGADGTNSVSFSNMGYNGALAYTSISLDSYTFEVIEARIVFNTAYSWGDAATDQNVFDFETVMIHEFGHVIGLGDLYNSECRDNRMYGYTSGGAVFPKKLGPGDKVGLKLLYR